MAKRCCEPWSEGSPRRDGCPMAASSPSTGDEIIQLDKAGKEVKRVAVMCGGAGCNEVLDNGHVLALSPGMGNLIEFDQDGNEISRFEQQGAAHAFRLPNGHTLVMVMGTKYIELDKNWQQIKETALTGDVFRVKMW